MSSFRIRDALATLGAGGYGFEFWGDDSVLIRSARSSDAAEDGSVSFVRADADVEDAARLATSRNLFVVPADFRGPTRADGNFLRAEDPEVLFYAVAGLLVDRTAPSISPFAVISPGATLSAGVTVGALTFIGPEVTVGDDVSIGVGCVLNNAVIGRGSVLQAGTKVGSDALGALKAADGRWVDRPHFGGVRIGCHVRIEDNVVINRGYLRDTEIASNVRVGPSTWIGNGVVVCAGALIAQAVTIAGSVHIGEDAAVWGNSSVREGVSIGRNAVVGMGAVVLRDIPEYQLWVGNPAAFKKQLRLSA